MEKAVHETGIKFPSCPHRGGKPWGSAGLREQPQTGQGVGEGTADSEEAGPPLRARGPQAERQGRSAHQQRRSVSLLPSASGEGGSEASLDCLPNEEAQPNTETLEMALKPLAS